MSADSVPSFIVAAGQQKAVKGGSEAAELFAPLHAGLRESPEVAGRRMPRLGHVPRLDKGRKKVAKLSIGCVRKVTQEDLVGSA